MTANDSQLAFYIEKEHPDWRLVADIDESESYEVDVTEIWRKPDGAFVLATATGCSCWDGEYDTEDYASFEALAEAIGVASRAVRPYNPSLRGAEELLANARTAMTEALS